MNNNPLFLMPLLIGPGVILSGIFNLYFPAKKNNNFYGYRTKNSKRSLDRWKFAQKYHAIQMIKSGFVLTLLSIIGLFVRIENNAIATCIGLGYAIFLVIFVMYTTDKALGKKFG